MTSNDALWHIHCQLPLSDIAIIGAREKQVTIDSHACDRLFMTLHLFLKRRISYTVTLNVSVITTDEDLTFIRVLVEPEVKDEHLISFILSSRSLLDPAVLDDVAQLWEDRCTSLVCSASLALRDLPYCNMTIVITSDQILRVLPLASGDAGDSFTVAPIIWAFKQDRAIDLQVPQSDGTLLVASGYQAAVW